MTFDDGRWIGLKGGYGMAFDPRPLLVKLESGLDVDHVWGELWDELHHQGDVGEASFAAVPHLARIYRERGGLGWNTYAIVAIIELRRNEGKNPDVPDWLRDEYFNAIRDLARIAQSQIETAQESEETRAMLSIVAIEKGLRVHARFLLEYSEEELQGMDFGE
jgi:hypothetical protein